MAINYVYISRTKTIVTIIFRANGKNYYYCFLLLSFIPRRRSYQLSRKSLSGLILRLKYNNIITIYLRRRMYTTMSVNTFCFHFSQMDYRLLFTLLHTHCDFVLVILKYWLRFIINQSTCFRKFLYAIVIYIIVHI